MPPQKPNPRDVFNAELIRSIFLQDQGLPCFFSDFFDLQRRTKPPFGTTLVQKLSHTKRLNTGIQNYLKKVSTNTPYLLAKTFVATINSSIMPTANKRQGRRTIALHTAIRKFD
jgi:hypothetical protein